MRRTVLLVVLAALVGALVAVPIAVYASHQFTDVPNTNPFHADIDWLADAGVTKGCSTTAYCPQNNVTREQMAAFMRRLSGNDPTVAPSVNAATAVDAEMADQLHGLYYATVNSDSALYAGNALSASTSAAGRYEVVFDRDTSGCTAVVSEGQVPGYDSWANGADMQAHVGTTGASSDPNTVSVWSLSNGQWFDTPFHLIMICP